MQGTVFGSLICTSVIYLDLPKYFTRMNHYYISTKTKYRCLCSEWWMMFCVFVCVKLAAKKCAKIHIGRKSGECPEYKIHKETLIESSSEKYLGDMISEKGTLDETIKQRKIKGYSCISAIRALLSDMSCGHRRVQVGLMLRDAMFVNGILCNAEAWHNISKNT